ncbi:class II fumarate hydratase [Ornithinimicrobium sediminis]|uniref:class II fumarate hydratase n=1 Tax=Ornithinimicrobium sediminis TaxID=2904603 RepID=UPI001E621F74|nr:class II fumarate hydratase [Ornithinimicrobium sediminis]MCE0485617.1 class II fumarate hydratase [Ornithinimicrobium sediminis]
MTTSDQDQRTRTEHDSMGEIEVPVDALYGAQTARAVLNFPISGQRVPTEVVHALARVKQCAATVNADLGVLDADLASAIADAADEVARGLHDEHFPVDVYQTGSGTSTNMNVNEVVARLASRGGLTVHPNDHVNAGQSSNDTFPTALRIVAVDLARTVLDPGLAALEEALLAKAEELADVVKAGRTHLMDAVPVTLGQELAGYARQVALGRRRVAEAVAGAAELPLGGTAAGTGINAHPEFAPRVIAALSEELGLELREAEDHFEAQSAQDALVALSGAARVVAVSLTKICNDLRWMGSGPRAGLGEIRLPDLQPGSSIMPGKVNPVLPEATLMVCARVIGNDTTMTVAGASGAFELNVMLPVMGSCLVETLTLLGRSTAHLAEATVRGIEADEARCRELAESSSSIVTPLNRYIGYEAAAAVAKQSLATRRTIREVVLERGHVERGELTEEQLDQALDVLGMARPHA